MVSGTRLMSRRTSVGLGLAAVLLCGTSGIQAHPMQDPAPAAAAQAPAKPDPFKFSDEFVLLVNQIKPEKAADFESAWSTIIAKLTASDKPGLKEMVSIATKGKGAMPPKGGDASLTDAELTRAVIFMANQSGAQFKEPAAAAPKKKSK